MTNQTCPIWGTPATYIGHIGPTDSELWDSPRAGGRFVVTAEAVAEVGDVPDGDKIRLTTWIVNQNRLSSTPPAVALGDIDRIKADRDLTVLERRDALLTYLQRKETRIGSGVQVGGTVSEEYLVSQAELLAWTGSLDHKEVYYLIDSSVDTGHTKLIKSPQPTLRLTTHGYEYLQNLQSVQSSSEQAFVAMWFDETMRQAYDMGFHTAITDTGYRPMRIDRKEHINKIDDEIVAEIRRSRFVVADFTSEPDNPRGGVYFEAGFAYGLQIPVIWTCRDDLIHHVHFDTRQFNHIVWSAPDDLYTKLKNRIGAVIGEGPLTKVTIEH